MSVLTNIINTAPQIGFNPKAYVIDEEAGTAILQIITNAPQRFFNTSGALYYTTDGTATSSEGKVVLYSLYRY